MRFKAAILACGLALQVGGCLLVEERLIAEGIGTELPAADIAESTRRLDIYLSFLCQQAGMARPDGDGFVCDTTRYGNASLSLLVRAGFNDIDRRCDSYLAWLNSRRRNRNAILNQISDTRTFTEALMYTTGSGAAPIAIAGLAFGLASNTFTNYYSRLLLEIEKSTVEVLVHEKRLQYREALNARIAFLPDAVHVLREYLLICTPHYIENRINQRTRDSVAGNPSSDELHPEQIRKSLVSSALIQSIPSKPSAPLPGAGGNPGPAPEQKMSGGETNSERNMPRSIGLSIQEHVCARPTGSFDTQTRNAIQQAKLGGNQSGPTAMPFGNTSSQIASAGEVQIFLGARPCAIDMTGADRGYRTAFEKFAFPSEGGVTSVQIILARCDPALKDKFTGKFDELTRAAITVAKSKIPQARRAGLTDLNTDTLNDKSYNAIERTCR
jgi:hypothetical protein